MSNLSDSLSDSSQDLLYMDSLFDEQDENQEDSDDTEDIADNTDEKISTASNKELSSTATKKPKRRKKVNPKPKPPTEYDDNGNKIEKKRSQTKEEQARKKLMFNQSRAKWFEEYFTGEIPTLYGMHISSDPEKLLKNEDQLDLAELIQAGIAGKMMLNRVETLEDADDPIHMQTTIVKDQDQVIDILTKNGYPPTRFEKGSEYRKTLERLVKDGDEARNIFAMKNRGLVSLVVNRRRKTSNTGNADYDDLMAEGMNGLMIAIDHFNPDLGNLFSTPATWWIDQPIRNYLDSKTKTIHMPTHMNNIYKAIYYAMKILRNKYSSDEEITDKMISDYCRSTGRDISVEKIQEARLLRRETSSYDAPAGDSGRNEKSIVEMIASADDVAGDVTETLSGNTNFDRMLSLIDDGKKRSILRDWYMSNNNNDGITLSNISRKYCLTKERVRQLKNDGERELKDKMLNIAEIKGVRPEEIFYE